jgi:hypothetical protein
MCKSGISEAIDVPKLILGEVSYYAMIEANVDRRNKENSAS